MYLRFVTLSKDKDSRQKEGLIIAAGRLIDEGELDRFELEMVKRIIDWFNEKMKVPSLLKDPGNNRCVAWFKSEAKEPLNMMWELYYLLQSKGIPVEVMKESDVGEIRYEDEWQIVAQGHRHNRKRHY